MLKKLGWGVLAGTLSGINIALMTIGGMSYMGYWN